MYQRIKNKLDMEIIKDFLESEQTNQNVVRRMEELTDILDGAYDGSRGAFDMGGYILFFGDIQTYENPTAKRVAEKSFTRSASIPGISKIAKIIRR